MADAAGRVAELEAFALEKLPGMQLADASFCYEVVKGDPTPRGRSLRYTLMALLGLLRADGVGREHELDTGRIKQRMLSEIDSPELDAGELGLFLWADSRSGHEATDGLVRRLDDVIGKRGYPLLEGLELAWVVTGLAAAGAERSSPRGELLLERGLRQLNDNLMFTGLLTHRGQGWRRRFPNFATEIYGVLALALVGRLRDDAPAIDAARRIAARLIALQRRNGGWPWLFDASRGNVVEPFEIYSVHQDAMAPMALLELTEATGDGLYRDAAVRGLDWIWGRNELGAQMLDSEAGMLYRSIVRRPPSDRVYPRVSTVTGYLGRPLLAGHLGRLEVNETDRPYHLGWVLEAWSGREGAASGASSSA